MCILYDTLLHHFLILSTEGIKKLEASNMFRCCSICNTKTRTPPTLHDVLRLVIWLYFLTVVKVIIRCSVISCSINGVVQWLYKKERNSCTRVNTLPQDQQWCANGDAFQEGLSSCSVECWQHIISASSPSAVLIRVFNTFCPRVRPSFCLHVSLLTYSSPMCSLFLSH